MLVLGIETTCDETAAAVVERSERRPRQDPVQHRAVADHRARRLRRRGAGDRRARPCRGARPHHRARRMTRGRHDASPTSTASPPPPGPGLIGGVIVGLTTAKAIALVARQAADRGQSSRGARADRAADRRDAVSLLPVPRLRRPHPDRRGARRRRLRAARHHASTTPSARPSTRPRSCSASAIPAARRSRRRRRAATPTRFALPRPMQGRPEPDFSLSGLKTALRLEAEKIAPLTDQDVADLCASFQQAVVDVVLDRLRAGLRMFRARFGTPTALVAAGGVAANQAIRKVLHRLAFEAGTVLVAPPLRAVHRQRRDDRLGRRRAAGARPDRPARRRAARALAARRDRRRRRRSRR